MNESITLIISEDEVKTANVSRCSIETHIAANDRLSTEAEILKAVIADVTEDIPLAYKYADTTGDSRLIYCESELAEITAIDSSLIVPIKTIEIGDGELLCESCGVVEWEVDKTGHGVQCPSCRV